MPRYMTILQKFTSFLKIIFMSNSSAPLSSNAGSKSDLLPFFSYYFDAHEDDKRREEDNASILFHYFLPPN